MVALVLITAVAASVTPSLVAVRASVAPTMDGRLDEPVWAQAATTDQFTQKFPHEGAAPSERTMLRVLYDANGIYVGVDCEHAQTPVIAQMTRRDREIESDWITIAFDPRGEGVNAFEFSVNAAGVQREGVRFNDTEYSSDWDSNWEAKVIQTATGWSAEIRIPLSIFRHRSQPIQSWGLQARRYIAARGETNEWALIPRDAAGEVSRYGRLVDLQNLGDANGVELRPFALGWLEHGAQGDAWGVTAGLDLRWRIHPNVSVDATFNPDFGQVEVDQQVLNLSTYETFFPEKRPFFLEGFDVFTTPMQLLYTRRIGRVAPVPVLLTAEEQPAETAQPATILGAARIVGRIGDATTAAAVSAWTGRNEIETALPSGQHQQRLADPITAFHVLRLQQRVSDRFQLGTLATSTHRFEDPTRYVVSPDGMVICPSGATTTVGDCFHDSYAAAVDGRWRSTSGDYAVTGQATSSRIAGGSTRPLLDGTLIADGDLGVGGYLVVAKEGGDHWLWRAAYEGASRRLELNDLGYLQRQNRHHVTADLHYRTLTPWLSTVETNTHLVALEERNLDGLRLGRSLKLSTEWQFRNRWTIYSGAHIRPAYFDDREVGDGTAVERARRLGYQLDVTTDPAASVSAMFQSTTERLPGGVNFDAALTVGWRPVSQLELEVIPEFLYSAGELRYLGPGQTSGSHRLGELEASRLSITFRETYTFTPRLSLQAYAQLFTSAGAYTNVSTYEAASPDSKLIRIADVPPGQGVAEEGFRNRSVNVNVVLRWEYKLGSSLFLVYSRAQNADDVGAYANAELELASLRGAPAVDTVLLKLSYWADR